MVEAMEIQKGFIKTEVGLIPNDWEVKKLSELAEIKDGTHQTPKYVEFGIPFYSVESVTANDFVKTKFISKEEHYRLTKNWRIEKGDILMTRIGSLGVCKLIDWNVNASFYVSLALLKLNKGLSPNYFLQYSKSNQFTKEIVLNALLFAYPQKINLGEISKVRISIPKTIEEQTAIATALNDTDVLITQLEKLIAKKRAIKQGALQELLKPKEGWEGFNYYQVFRKLKGKNCQIQTKEYQQSGKYPIIDQGKEKIVGYTDNLSKLFNCPKNGLIVFGDHTREIKFIDFDFVIGADGTQLLSVNDNHSIKFYYYRLLLNEVPNTGYNRHFKFLLEMIFYSPKEKSEQNRIANILSDMDAEIEALEKKLDKYKMLKLGMMQNLLTGKIRLI